MSRSVLGRFSDQSGSASHPICATTRAQRTFGVSDNFIIGKSRAGQALSVVMQAAVSSEAGADPAGGRTDFSRSICSRPTESMAYVAEVMLLLPCMLVSTAELSLNIIDSSDGDGDGDSAHLCSPQPGGQFALPSDPVCCICLAHGLGSAACRSGFHPTCASPPISLPLPIQPYKNVSPPLVNQSQKEACL